MSKPEWLKVKTPVGSGYSETYKIVQQHNLNTVCAEAACPNIGECWNRKHAAFMILGSICTRNCAFCNVICGRPPVVDPEEPKMLANAVQKMGLEYVVITSVTRDDLVDGGANQFALCISAIKNANSKIMVEVLIPDFLNKKGALEIVLAARPDILNHNIESVPSLYSIVKPGANYNNALDVLKRAKEQNVKVYTKSGIMVGLGESDEEIFDVLENLRSVDVDFLTIGQYLQPNSESNMPVDRFVSPEEFDLYKKIAYQKGFRAVASGPLVRSSYNAAQMIQDLL